MRISNMFFKITKEEWDKMSTIDKEYQTAKFIQSTEKFRRIMFVFSRILAIALICSIIFFGYAYIAYGQHTTKLFDQYGNDAYCYLCGEKRFKQCECVYYRPELLEQINLTAEGLRLSEYNIRQCTEKRGTDYQEEINISEIEFYNILN